MNDLVEYLKNNPQLVPIVAAIFAVTGVVLAALLSAFVAFTVSKRSTYITSVTAERSKWIEKLRGNIAELLSLCSSINMALPEKTGDAALAKRRDADRLVALITLQLNPFDKSGIDQNLINLLPKLVQSSEDESGKYREIEKQFVRHAQFLLKEEWEKVKLEAKGMIIALFTGAYGKRKERSEQYRKFCAGGAGK